MNRRHFIGALGCGLASSGFVLPAGATSLHCTPAPRFPVPLTVGVWHSQEFPVGKHDYHVWLEVDRQVPSAELDCDLEPPSPWRQCGSRPPLLDLEWKIWDGTTLVQSGPSRPIKAAAWSDRATSFLLGDFEGKRNGHFTLELNCKKDAGMLKDLHPRRIQIVKNPGYWCWL